MFFTTHPPCHRVGLHSSRNFFLVVLAGSILSWAALVLLFHAKASLGSTPEHVMACLGYPRFSLMLRGSSHLPEPPTGGGVQRTTH